jgi:quinol monooxygenase YgiN
MELLKLTINCRQNKRGELFRTCQSIAEQTRLETGCVQSQVAQESNDESLIILEQQWKQWPELNSYLSSDYFKALLGAMKLLGQSYTIQINGSTEEEWKNGVKLVSGLSI